MPVVFIDFAYWGLEPLLGGLRRLGVRPDRVTAFSLYLAVLAAAALATGYFGVGAWLLVAAAGCDLLDSALARSTNAASPAGAFLDSVIDRLTESVVFFGIGLHALLSAHTVLSRARSMVRPTSSTTAASTRPFASARTERCQRRPVVIWIIVGGIYPAKVR